MDWLLHGEYSCGNPVTLWGKYFYPAVCHSKLSVDSLKRLNDETVLDLPVTQPLRSDAQGHPLLQRI